MPSIRDYVKSNLGETYDKLSDVALYDGQTKPDVTGIKISALLSRFSVTEDELNDFCKSYLGDWATLNLIPIAMDYYMVNTRMVDNAQRPSGVTPLGGEVGQNYNRVIVLNRIKDEMQTRLSEGKNTFASFMPSTATIGGLFTAGMITSGHTKTLRTQDPYDSFDKVGGAVYGPVGYEIGAAYVVVMQELV